MEKPVFIQDISQYVDQSVTLRGWVFNARSSGSITFLQFRDGSGFIQAVVEKSAVSDEAWQAATSVTIESSVILTGTVSQHPKKDHVYELQVSDVQVVQQAAEYPIGKKEHGPDFLLDNRHLWLRSSKQWAVMRVRDRIIRAVYEFFASQGFAKVDTPIITPNACEGSTTLFEIDYFDQGKGYLSQSGQLYLEAAIMSVGRGFDFGPVFRAEKSKTRRHLTEFWMMDAEAAFVEHEENMQIQENMIVAIVQACLEDCRTELEILERDVKPLEGIKAPFTRLSYSEAVEKLQSLGSDITFGDDLGGDDESLLTTDSPVPVFIDRWPKDIKPFYMKRDPDNPDLVLNNDLIGIEDSGELIGGSQREDDYQLLLERILAEGLDQAEYQWYLDLRQYGSVPHSGFGLGLERTVRWICGIEHVRETIAFPRLLNRMRP